MTLFFILVGLLIATILMAYILRGLYICFSFSGSDNILKQCSNTIALHVYSLDSEEKGKTSDGYTYYNRFFPETNKRFSKPSSRFVFTFWSLFFAIPAYTLALSPIQMYYRGTWENCIGTWLFYLSILLVLFVVAFCVVYDYRFHNISKPYYEYEGKNRCIMYYHNIGKAIHNLPDKLAQQSAIKDFNLLMNKADFDNNNRIVYLHHLFFIFLTKGRTGIALDVLDDTEDSVWSNERKNVRELLEDTAIYVSIPSITNGVARSYGFLRNYYVGSEDITANAIGNGSFNGELVAALSIASKI